MEENTQETEIVSIFTVTNFRTGKQIEESIHGDGQDAINYVRTLYPRHTKFVLDGFEINATFVPLYIKNKNND